MIDRTNLPDFMQNMTEERLREIMEDKPKRNFDDVMGVILHASAKKHNKKTTISRRK